MAATLPSAIFGLRGQCVKSVDWDEAADELWVTCRRDRRYKPIASRRGGTGPVNQWLRRRVRDLPLWGRPVMLDIEYGQIKRGATDRRVEWLPFVEPGYGFTRRFARFIKQLCRHLPINAVADYTGLAWRTVKRMDQRALQQELPALDPGALTGLRHLGVDEVARAKGHDYLTIVYDLDSGDLIRVTEGRSKAGLLCNSAEHPITTARLEGGNVAVGMIRKRAKGLLDTEYFKLKIRQSALPEEPLGLYALTG